VQPVRRRALIKSHSLTRTPKLTDFNMFNSSVISHASRNIVVNHSQFLNILDKYEVI